MTLLSWSVIEDSAKYNAAGELNHVKDIIKWGTDYILKTFSSSASTIDVITGQVGIGDTSGGSEEAHNDDTAGRALRISITLDLYRRMSQDIGTSLFGELPGCIMPGNYSYLHLATTPGLAKKADAFSIGPDYGVLSWDNKLPGAQPIKDVVESRLPLGGNAEGHFRIGPGQVHKLKVLYFLSGGLIQLNHGKLRPLQHVVNAAFLASLYSDYLDAAGTKGSFCGPNFFSTDILRKFAKTQIDYIYIQQPSKNELCGGIWQPPSKPNPNTIVAAMVGGPDKHDGFHDFRPNYNYTEPTLAGNAGLVAALVALSGHGSTGFDKHTIFSALPPPRKP
ncbi:hypothetical protein SLEP1_g22515 [Rubroshorea leprosula]|uniref:Endoglucanase n=1 Tax=Rubroshorea leprosula TaxID=152421 RepID=A0AAV5JFH9_9ROSI|nr:hypothetical protein SLEP1_g22515 [Rubroshorea leprosula]